jgi:AAA domain
MTLDDIHTITATLPPRVLVHGQEGTGKTTLGINFPKPVFVQVEDGTPGGLHLASFGLLDTFPKVRDALAALASEPHDYQTVVVDALDELEGLIWADVCAARGWPSIETPGYGKGYVEVDLWWHDFLKALEYLRRERGMVVLLLAHSAIETITDPRVPSYTSYQLRLHKRARALVQDWADVIGFLAPDLHVKTEEVGFGKQRNRADGGATRWLHTEGRPSFVAKNRYGLPPKIMIPRDLDYDAALAPYFPPAARPTVESSKQPIPKIGAKQ